MSIDELIQAGRPVIMGILNVTPDSFSDGGLHNGVQDAVAHALQMVEEGASIIDVGGESTRPGSRRVDVDDQLRRVVPVIEALVDHIPEGAFISVDTSRAAVAEAALNAGAAMINDVSAARDDDGHMLDLAARREVPVVLMHMLGTPETMQQDPQYTDVAREVHDFLLQRAEAALAAGVERARILIDPGIGFGKTREHNLALMKGLSSLVETGYPVLLGASRKRFMGSICAETDPGELVGATCATTALGVAAGVRLFRVHDVRANRQAAEVAWAVLHAG